MSKPAYNLILLMVLTPLTALSADGKRNIAAACLPETFKDAEYLERRKGGVLRNVNRSSSHELSVVCPVLNDVIAASKTKVNVIYQGEVYCVVYSYSKEGEDYDWDYETANSGNKIKQMNFEISETNGQMEIYCVINGGSQMISYGWTEDPS